MRILPRNGRIAWVLRSRACLALPPAESPSTMNSSEPSVAVLVQSASLPGRRSFFTAVLREVSFSARRRSRSSARSMTKSRSLLACSGLPDSQWSNGSLIACSTMRWASAVASRSLVWPWNSGSRTNTESITAAPTITSSEVIGGGALALADALGMVFQAAQHGAAHAGFVGAAVGRRHGVAIGGKEAVGIRRPRDRPFAGAMGAVAAGFAGEDIRMHQRVGMNGGGEIILQAAGEVKLSSAGTSSMPFSSSGSQRQRILTPPNR